MNERLSSVCTTQKTVMFILTTFRTLDLIYFVIRSIVRIHSVIIHVQICLQSHWRRMSHHPVNPTDDYVKYLYAVVLFSELRAYIGLRLPEFCVILYRLETRLRTARNLINTDES